MTQYIVVFVTAPSEKTAVKISHSLIQEKLAACVNIIPKIRSFYTWKNKLCDDNEVLLIIKTNKKSFDRLVKHITSLHPYETPEIIALPITAGNKPYLDWLKNGIRITSKT
ncbi:MAG: divalent-cation tolerance protein CutA [Planctomycetes bacterium]|nr:divalent-cation tolerance protein CutA [Planctomycetota bacterium]